MFTSTCWPYHRHAITAMVNSGLAGQDAPKVTQASAVPVFKLAD